MQREKVVEYYNEYIDFIENIEPDMRLGGAFLFFRKIFLEFDMYEKSNPTNLYNFIELNETETTNPLTLFDLFMECYVTDEFYYFKDHIFGEKTWTWDFSKGNINNKSIDFNFYNFIFREKGEKTVNVYMKLKTNATVLMQFKIKNVKGKDKITGLQNIHVYKEEKNHYGNVIIKKLFLDFLSDKKSNGTYTTSLITIDDIKEVCELMFPSEDIEIDLLI